MPAALERATSRRFEVEIFLICFAAVLLEVSYTRVISFKLFYYYTYVVIGFALLGIGSGGVLVSVFPRLARAPLERLVGAGALAASFAVALGYLVVALLPTDSARLWDEPGPEVAKIFLICLALFASFLPIGIVISALLGRHPGRIARLYFADMLGAGTACAAAVPLLRLLTPPGCIALAGLLLALLAGRLAGVGRGRSSPRPASRAPPSPGPSRFRKRCPSRWRTPPRPSSPARLGASAPGTRCSAST